MPRYTNPTMSGEAKKALDALHNDPVSHGFPPSTVEPKKTLREKLSKAFEFMRLRMSRRK
jgi:hypothetical protein